jgi:hypothetical protein
MTEAAFLVLGALISFAGFTYAIRNATRRRWREYVQRNGRQSLARILSAETGKQGVDLTVDPGDGGRPVFIWSVPPGPGLEPDDSVTIVYDERTRVGMLRT